MSKVSSIAKKSWHEEPKMVKIYYWDHKEFYPQQSKKEKEKRMNYNQCN